MYVMQRAIFQGLSLRLSDRLSNAWIVTSKETCAHILIPHKRPFILVFWHEEWLVGATPSTWNFGPNWPCWS